MKINANEWEMRDLSAIPVTEICSLLSKSMNDSTATQKTESFWRWKHTDNPFGHSVGLAAVASSGELISLRPFMRWNLAIGATTTLSAVRPVDTATAEDWRGRGIFSTLTRQALLGLESSSVAFIFNTPNANSRPGYLKMGWQVVGVLPIYISILRPFQVVKALLTRHPVEAILPEWKEISSNAIVSWRDFEDKTALLRLATQSEEARGYHGLRTPRDAKFLSWRYGNQPNADYGVFSLSGEATALRAIAVLRLETRYGLLGALMTDLFVNQNDPKTGVQLLRKLRKDLQVDYIIAHVGSNAPEKTILKRSFFFQVPHRGIVLTARKMSSTVYSGLNPFQKAAWDLTLNELELF